MNTLTMRYSENGPISTLRGKTALVRICYGSGAVAAQFDDFSTSPYCYGWAGCRIDDFDLIEEGTQ